MEADLDSAHSQFLQFTASCSNTTKDYQDQLWGYIYESVHRNWYSKPLPWIGIYIASASLLCVIALVADLLHGLHNRKLWFPCKYFSLNAASLTVIAVAIKLPMDLTNLTPGVVDRTAKLGSLSFMCTMMANLLPSLATMGAKEIVSNVIALGILVITLVVNVCIQIRTGVLSYRETDGIFIGTYSHNILKYLPGESQAEFIAAIYVGMLLMLLIIYACSSLAIVKSIQMLESKYQSTHQTALKVLELLQPGRLTVEMLKKHMSYYWIMAGTRSPQLVTVCYATTSASGVICALSTVLHILTVPYNIEYMKDSDTNYKWTMVVILAVQFTGVILGTLVPLSRCFSPLSFKLSRKWIRNHVNVFKVESYWTRKLSDWKQRSIPYELSSRKGKIVMESLKILFLSICIGFQKTVVVACKMIGFFPLLFVICVPYCFRCWKWLNAMFCASGTVLVQNQEQPKEKYKDLSRYVMQLQDNVEFAERTLKRISKSLKHLIQEAEKQQQPCYSLMKLLTESRGFEGVQKFDNDNVPHLLSEECLKCWSLPLVTLTEIAISFHDVPRDIVNGLLSGVGEGLVYVTLVEESLNASDNHVSIQKVAKTLWLEVGLYHKWFGNKLPKPGDTVRQILEWLRDTAKNMVAEVESTYIGVRDDDSKYSSVSANSMYRITETLLLSYHANIEQVSQEEVFAQLTSVIADILAACLTNLPHVIAMKCDAREIEKRKASVHASCSSTSR